MFKELNNLVTKVWLNNKPVFDINLKDFYFDDFKEHWNLLNTASERKAYLEYVLTNCPGFKDSITTLLEPIEAISVPNRKPELGHYVGEALLTLTHISRNLGSLTKLQEKSPSYLVDVLGSITPYEHSLLLNWLDGKKFDTKAFKGMTVKFLKEVGLLGKTTS